MGVRIAIDDFGTGFSSLNYLSRLPVDTLKIDPTFVREITAGPQGLALVSTIVNLAHSLRLTVVAEGSRRKSRLSCCGPSSATRCRVICSAGPCPQGRSRRAIWSAGQRGYLRFDGPLLRRSIEVESFAIAPKGEIDPMAKLDDETTA
ncbi:MAG: phosphodiesterase [Gammaproteobacteria bacterium]|nr:phosphodiesterase [Gammaproteobacteria bacterium]